MSCCLTLEYDSQHKGNHGKWAKITLIKVTIITLNETDTNGWHTVLSKQRLNSLLLISNSY